MLKRLISFKYLKSHPTAIIFFLILAVGIFLRTYHFSDWLFFQGDQSRDALIARSIVLDGMEKMPLVGPQISGSSFHLGPILYYFQYLSGIIFGPSPESFSYPDLFFGILTIPLLFLILRKFVSRPTALYITALSSVTLFLVTFSRFAWNPNSLPFFTTLFALLFVSAIQKNNQRHWQLVGAATALGIIAQLHFVAALSLMAGLFVFLIYYRPLKWKELLMCSLIFLFFQLPTIIYEAKNPGAVSRAFLETAKDRAFFKYKTHGIHEKVFRAYQSEAEIFWLIASGRLNTELILTRGFDIKCDDKCRAGLPATIPALLFLAFFIWNGFQFWRKENDPAKKKFLTFLSLWFVSFFIFTSIFAYELKVRFYLGITPLIFLILAMAVEKLCRLFRNKKIFFLFAAVLAFSLLSNLFTTLAYFKELAGSGRALIQDHRDLVFGNKKKTTLSQLRAMAHEIDRQFPDNSPIFISGESRYVRSVFYILTAEKGRIACYEKGHPDMPASLNHAKVNYNKGKKDNIPFGTLAIKLSRPDAENKNDKFPIGCLQN